MALPSARSRRRAATCRPRTWPGGRPRSTAIELELWRRTSYAQTTETRGRARGQQLVSGVAPAGELFGWSGIAAALSSAEITALTHGEVAQWPGAEIRALAAADPALALAAIDSMAASLHQTVERIEGFLHQDARRRVLRILARHRNLFFQEPAVLTRGELPGLVGTSREMTGRVLRQLEREGTIKRVGRAGLRLLRPERLETGAS